MKRSGQIKPRKMATFHCERCSTPFQRRADQPSRQRDGLVLCNHCSRVVRSEGRVYEERRTGKSAICTVCGAEFYRSASRSGSFCSRKCVDVWRIDHPQPNFIGSADNRGEKNGRYRHGGRVGTNVSKKVVRSSVIERDGGEWCLICGKPGPGLHLHRVIYGSQGGKYEVGNCVLLCGEHHAVVHSDKRTWMPKLLSHLANPESPDETI